MGAILSTQRAPRRGRRRGSTRGSSGWSPDTSRKGSFMRYLVEGRWITTDQRPTGQSIRSDPQFRNWVTTVARPGGFKAEAGRYHLYVSLACPWASRTLMFRSLKALEPWYGPVCPVLWEGRSREAPPYPDRWRMATAGGISPVRPLVILDLPRAVAVAMMPARLASPARTARSILAGARIPDAHHVAIARRLLPGQGWQRRRSLAGAFRNTSTARRC
jgi:hypothetical protein